jgi:hypothetical protein
MSNESYLSCNERFKQEYREKVQNMVSNLVPTFISSSSNDSEPGTARLNLGFLNRCINNKMSSYFCYSDVNIESFCSVRNKI